MARSIRRDLFNRTEHRTHHVAGRLCFLFESDQECHREGSDPPNMESQKIKLKSHPVWLRFGGSKRCHLPVICLGKTRRNPNINSELMFGFRVVFYRETKWPNVVSEIDFGSRFRTHFGARRNVWAFENVKTLPKQGPEKGSRFGRV